MGNFFQDWTPSGDDEEQRKLRAWQALAGDQEPHRSMANQVQLPEMDVVADPRADEVDMTPPPTTDARAPSDSQPVDMSDPPPPPSATARMGAMLSGRDEAPAPPESLPRDEPHSMGNDASPWAVLADVLLNKGRGVGGILAQGSAGKSEERRAELDLKRAQAEHLRDPQYGNRGASPEALELRRRALDLQESGQKAAEERARLRAQGSDPDGKKAAGLLGFYGAHGVDTGGMEGLDYTTLLKVRPDVSKMFTNALAPETNQVAADRATGVKQAEGAVRDDRAEQEAANAAIKAGAEADARLPAQKVLKQTPGVLPTAPPVDPSKQVGIPGLDVDEADVFGANTVNPAARRALSDKVAGMQALDQAVTQMRGIRAQTGMQLMPSEKKSNYNAAYGAAIGALTDLYHSGVLNDKEYERYKAQIPTLDPHLSDAYDRVSGEKRDTVGEQLKGFQDETRALNSARLRTYGGHPHWADSGRQQPTDADGGPAAPSINATNPTPSASPAKGDYANYSRDTSDPNNLGKAPVPKIPTAAQRGTNISPRTVTKPDGTTKIENLSDEEAATLNARRGWSVK